MSLSKKLSSQEINDKFAEKMKMENKWASELYKLLYISNDDRAQSIKDRTMNRLTYNKLAQELWYETEEWDCYQFCWIDIENLWFRQKLLLRDLSYSERIKLSNEVTLIPWKEFQFHSIGKSLYHKDIWPSNHLYVARKVYELWEEWLLPQDFDIFINTMPWATKALQIRQFKYLTGVDHDYRTLKKRMWWIENQTPYYTVISMKNDNYWFKEDNINNHSNSWRPIKDIGA